MVDGEIEREIKDLVALLREEVLVVTRLGKMQVENLADLVADRQAGLAVFEPVLDEHPGGFCGQAFEQRLGREANCIPTLERGNETT